MIDDYLSNFESRRQRGYQDLQRELANDIAGYGGDHRRITDRSRRYAADMSDFNAAMDRSYDPDWWQKQQFEQARRTYEPLYQAAREQDQRQSAEVARTEAAYQAPREPDPMPNFDSRGELIDRTGVIDFDAGRRNAIARASSQFQEPNAYSHYGSQNFPVSQPTPQNFLPGIGYVEQEQPRVSARRAPMRSGMPNPNVMYASRGQGLGVADEPRARRPIPDYFDY